MRRLIPIFFAFILFSACAGMQPAKQLTLEETLRLAEEAGAGKKISDLSQETSIQDTDEVLIRRGLNNYRAQVQHLPSANPSDQFNKIKNAYYVSTNISVTDHADTAQSGSIADVITNEMSGAEGDIVLPGNKTYQIKQALTFPATARLVPQNGAIIDTDISIRSASYQWTLSGSGTSEYYLEASGGGNPNINEPDDVAENDALMTEAAVGTLAAGEWDWGNNDTLGFNTVYVRLSDSTDPDGKAADYVEAGYTLTINGPFEAGLYQTFTGTGAVTLGVECGVEIVPQLWGTKSADDTAAFTAACTSATASGRRLFIPKGTYTVTDSLPKIQHVKGEGIWETTINFLPTVANKILFDWSPDAAGLIAGTVMWQATVEDLLIRGGNAIDKIAIRHWHVVGGNIENVQVHFGDGSGDTSTGSIALSIMGNSECTVRDSILRGARPILAEDEATSSRNDLDHITFENLTLYNLIGSHPLIEFQITSSHVAFVGRQTWVGGTSAFYSTGFDLSNLSFNNIRWESGGIVQTQHTIYVVGASTGTETPYQGTIVSVRDSRFGIGGVYSGIYIRYIHMILLENVQGSVHTLPSTGGLYDVDGTVMHLTVINTNTAIGEIDPIIGADLKLVLSIGGAGNSSGIAYTRFYTSTKAFNGGYVGKPYVGLMDTLYWTYRGSLPDTDDVFITGEFITSIEYARVEIDAFKLADFTVNGSAIYTVLHDGVQGDEIITVSKTENGITFGAVSHLRLLTSAGVIYLENRLGFDVEVRIRVFYCPITPRL